MTLFSKLTTCNFENSMQLHFIQKPFVLIIFLLVIYFFLRKKLHIPIQ